LWRYSKHFQESDVLRESRFDLTRDLHVLQAHLLHDKALLHNFKISVTFIEETPNPAMYSTDFTNEQREMSKKLMKEECENLLSEIDRLEKRREMLISRLKNMLRLALATVNMEDSRQTRLLTEATVRDSAGMRQVPLLSLHRIAAIDPDEVPSDLISDNGIPTGKSHSRKHRGLLCRIYLTHVLLVCLRDERQRDQPYVSRDARSLRGNHHFAHSRNSLCRHHTSGAFSDSQGKLYVLGARNVADPFFQKVGAGDNNRLQNMDAGEINRQAEKEIREDVRRASVKMQISDIHPQFGGGYSGRVISIVVLVS
jgi:hypothetical protein